MKALPRDLDTFIKRFPKAVTFMLEAELRQEYWDLCALGEHPTTWAEKRRNELRQAPACNEAWFVLEIGRTFGQWPDGPVPAEVNDGE